MRGAREFDEAFHPDDQDSSKMDEECQSAPTMPEARNSNERSVQPECAREHLGAVIPRFARNDSLFRSRVGARRATCR